MGEADLGYAYAAYARGSFGDLIQKGLKGSEAFNPVFKAHLQHVNEAWIIKQELPIGLVVAMIKDNRMEPHVFWYQWATPRNKIEGTIKRPSVYFVVFGMDGPADGVGFDVDVFF